MDAANYAMIPAAFNSDKSLQDKCPRVWAWTFAEPSLRAIKGYAAKKKSAFG